MPNTIPVAADYLNNTLAGLQAQIDALARQQNAGIVDPQGRIRIKEGLQSDGTLATWYLDTAGNVQAKLGDLGSGVYGLSVRNPAGVFQQIAGRNISTIAGPLTYSSTSTGALSGGPSVTCQAGPSGQVDVAVSAVITPGSNAAGETAWLFVALNGTGQAWPYIAVTVGASSTAFGTAYGEATISGLTPGTTYTFSTRAAVTTNGVVANYSEVTLAVTPA